MDNNIPKIIADHGYIGASRYVLDNIFHGIFNYKDPDVSIKAIRVVVLDFLKDVVRGEFVDEHPDQYIHLFVSRFLMAKRCFSDAVKIVSKISTLEDESYCVVEEKDIFVCTISILYLDLVGVGLQSGKLFYGQQVAQVIDFGLPVSFILKQLKQGGGKPKKREYKAWIKYIECLDLHEEKISRNEIYKRVYGGATIANPSDTIAKALCRANKIVEAALNFSSFSEI